jgi:hypothetical protein
MLYALKNATNILTQLPNIAFHTSVDPMNLHKLKKLKQLSKQLSWVLLKVMLQVNKSWIYINPQRQFILLPQLPLFSASLTFTL